MGGKSRFTTEYKLLLDLLIQRRKKAGLTQQELADLMSKSQSHISKIELLDRELNIIDFRLWAKAVGVPLNEIVILWEQAILQSNQEAGGKPNK